MGAAQAVCDQVQRQVVASHGHNCSLNRLGRAKELHRHLRSGVEPLQEAGNTQKAVGPDQRHDHTGAALDGGRYRTLPNTAQAHPKELVLAHGEDTFLASLASTLRRLDPAEPSMLSTRGFTNISHVSAADTG